MSGLSDGGASLSELVRGAWRVPLRFSDSATFTNCYLLSDTDGVVIIDPGWDSDKNREQLSNALRSIDRNFSDVREVWSTHLHVDHVGIADWLYEVTGAPTRLSPEDASDLNAEAYRRRFSESVDEFGDLHGVPAAERNRLVTTPALTAQMVPQSIVTNTGEDAPTFEGHPLKVVDTPGHTRGHRCFSMASHKIMFSGDHILEKMRPGVGLGLIHDSDPVQDYLDSLKRMMAWDDYLVAPGHGVEFLPLGGRRRRLAAVYRQRIDEVKSLPFAHANIWDVASQLTWASGWESFRGMRLRSALTQVRLLLKHIGSSENLS